MITYCRKANSDDTAEKIGNLEECLYSTINRAKTAEFLCQAGRFDLVYTIIEDLAVGVQLLTEVLRRRKSK